MPAIRRRRGFRSRKSPLSKDFLECRHLLPRSGSINVVLDAAIKCSRILKKAHPHWKIAFTCPHPALTSSMGLSFARSGGEFNL